MGCKPIFYHFPNAFLSPSFLSQFFASFEIVGSLCVVLMRTSCVESRIELVCVVRPVTDCVVSRIELF